MTNATQRCAISMIAAGILICLGFMRTGSADAAAVSGVTAAISDATFDVIGTDALATGQAPGFAFAVVHGGKVVYANGFGFADLTRETPVTPQTRFAVGSITKQFTAAAILLLAQREQLALDDPLSRSVSAFPHAHAITLRMLLNQTSGLHNYPRLDEHDWPTSGPIAVDALLAILATDPLDFSPGTRWAYSNANYAVLSAVIAKVSRQSEGAFLQTEFFERLGMTSSGYGFDAQQRQPGPAPAYAGKGGAFKPQSALSLDLYSGAGAIVSTVSDLAAWDLGLMGSGPLDARSIATMWTAGQLGDGSPVNYAMGFVPATVGTHREVWHNGLAPGVGGYCYNAIFPDDGLAVIVLSNGDDFTGVPEQIVARVLAAYDPRVAAAPTPAPGEDPAVTARAKDWFHRLQTATVDLAQVTPAFAERLTPAFLEQVKDGLAAVGEPTDWTYEGSEGTGRVTIYRYAIILAGAAHTFLFGLGDDGKVAGSRLQ